MMRVTLSPDELYQAAIVGCHRHIQCLRANSPDKNFPDRENIRWATHIEAACSELAVCKLLGVYWSALDGPSALSDAGFGIQVRSTRYRTGCLILRERDSADANYVLVVARAPDYEIAGWLRGSERQDRHKRTNDRDPRPYWEIPQADLHPFRPLEREAA